MLQTKTLQKEKKTINIKVEKKNSCIPSSKKVARSKGPPKAGTASKSCVTIATSAGHTSEAGFDPEVFARHASAQILFSTTSLATVYAAASSDFDFSDAAPIVAAGDTGVGTDVTAAAAVMFVGATAAPGGRRDVLRGNRCECWN